MLINVSGPAIRISKMFQGTFNRVSFEEPGSCSFYIFVVRSALSNNRTLGNSPFSFLSLQPAWTFCVSVTQRIAPWIKSPWNEFFHPIPKKTGQWLHWWWNRRWWSIALLTVESDEFKMGCSPMGVKLFGWRWQLTSVGDGVRFATGDGVALAASNQCRRRGGCPMGDGFLAQAI